MRSVDYARIGEYLWRMSPLVQPLGYMPSPPDVERQWLSDGSVVGWTFPLWRGDSRALFLRECWEVPAASAGIELSGWLYGSDEELRSVLAVERTTQRQELMVFKQRYACDRVPQDSLDALVSGRLRPRRRADALSAALDILAAHVASRSKR